MLGLVPCPCLRLETNLAMRRPQVPWREVGDQAFVSRLKRVQVVMRPVLHLGRLVDP